MLHEALANYLETVEQAVLESEGIDVERYIEEVLTSKRANLRIRLRFAEGYLLEINEAVMVEDDRLTSLDYRYHCQNKQNHLIFRYDNTPHFPNLLTFPHHKHLPNAVIASEKPEISQVLQEVRKAIP